MPLVTCPGCGRQLRVTSLTKRVRCPRPDCGAVFVPSQAEGGTSGASASGRSDAEFSPADQSASAGGAAAGFLDDIPDDLLAAAQPMAPVQQLPGAGALPRTSPRKPSQKGLSGPMIAAIIGGIVGVVALVIVILLLAVSGREKPAPPRPASPAVTATTPPAPPAPAPAPPATSPSTPSTAGPASSSQATPTSGALDVDLASFALADAEGIVRIVLAQLPANAVWYEEFYAAVRPVLLAVEPYIGKVTDLLAVRKGDGVLYAFRCAEGIDVNKLLTSWQASRVSEVSGVTVYGIPTSPQRIAFPNAATMLVGPEELVKASLERAGSASSQAVHPLLAKAGIQTGTEVPVFAVVPSEWMRNQLTKALAFVVEQQQEELRDALQRPEYTALVLVPQQNNAGFIDLFFQCKSKGDADVFGRWVAGLPDFARRLQDSVSRQGQSRPSPPRSGNPEEGEVVSDPGRHRRNQIAGAVAALAGIWRDAEVQGQDNVVRVRAKIPTNDDWITNRVELATATIGSVLGTDAVGIWPYYGPLIRTGLGINGYVAAHDRSFPQGTIPIRDDKNWVFLRMSWMVHILPYIGRQNLYDSLDLQNSWTNPTNVRAALTVVDEFLDPRIPIRRGEEQPYLGLALTHFVGMGGVGVDAPTLPADHPRAGVFAYDRVTHVNDIKDGATQTIMLIEAYDVYGPWVAGGGATIRAAQRPPYILSTGGFGSPGDPPGVYVLMADGSARYISKDIAPEVFEALCTIAGSEKILLEQQGTLSNGLPVLTGKREEQ